MTDLRIERPFAVLARLRRLPRHEAEIAGAERGAIARDRRNVVARLEGLVLDLESRARHGSHHLDLDGLAGARKPLMQIRRRGRDLLAEHLVPDLVIRMHRAFGGVVLIDAHDIRNAGTGRAPAPP